MRTPDKILKSLIKKTVLRDVPGTIDEHTLQFGAPGSGLAAFTGPDMYPLLLNHLQQWATAADNETRLMHHGMFHRGASLADMTDPIYDLAVNNPASMGNWFPYVHAALTAQTDRGEAPAFHTPRTQILRLGQELAQYLRLDFMDEANDVSKRAFDTYIFDRFDLDMDTKYFIKTGAFSNKFFFRNCMCEEADEMGQYFHLMMNTAMVVGAGATVDLVVRDFIDAKTNTPSIYAGMPLRCEMRAFVDLGSDADNPCVMGVVPYWHESVMKAALAMVRDAEQMDGNSAGLGAEQHDFDTWYAHKDKLQAQFDAYLPAVIARLEALLPDLAAARISDTALNRAGAYPDNHLRARGADATRYWSVDIMLTGAELENTTDSADSAAKFWLIDMAPMSTSALVDELLITDEYRAVDADTITRAGKAQWLLPPEMADAFAGHYDRVIDYPAV